MKCYRGFTLVEVLVALAVSGLVVLIAARIFAAVGDGGKELRESRSALDREANARRWLQAAFLSLDVGQDSVAGPFEGRADRVRFGTWLQTADGWFVERRLELRLQGGAFVAAAASTEQGAGQDGSRVVLADSVSDVAFDYLLEPGENTTWVREWSSPVSAPWAARIRLTRTRRNGNRETGDMVTDTLVLLIKARG